MCFALQDLGSTNTRPPAPPVPQFRGPPVVDPLGPPEPPAPPLVIQSGPLRGFEVGTQPRTTPPTSSATGFISATAQVFSIGTPEEVTPRNSGPPQAAAGGPPAPSPVQEDSCLVPASAAAVQGVMQLFSGELCNESCEPSAPESVQGGPLQSEAPVVAQEGGPPPSGPQASEEYWDAAERDERERLFAAKLAKLSPEEKEAREAEYQESVAWAKARNAVQKATKKAKAQGPAPPSAPPPADQVGPPPEPYGGPPPADVKRMREIAMNYWAGRDPLAGGAPPPPKPSASRREPKSTPPRTPRTSSPPKTLLDKDVACSLVPLDPASTGPLLALQGGGSGTASSITDDWLDQDVAAVPEPLEQTSGGPQTLLPAEGGGPGTSAGPLQGVFMHPMDLTAAEQRMVYPPPPARPAVSPFVFPPRPKQQTKQTAKQLASRMKGPPAKPPEGLVPPPEPVMSDAEHIASQQPEALPLSQRGPPPGFEDAGPQHTKQGPPPGFSNAAASKAAWKQEVTAMEKKFLDTNAAALEGVAAGAAEKNEVLPNDGESSSSWEDGERKNKVLPEGVFETADVQENKHEALPIGHDGTIVVVPSVWQLMNLAEEALNLSRWQKLYNLACHHMYWSDKENASLSAYVINEGRKEGREIASTEDGEENEDQGKHGALSEHHQDRLVVGGHYPLHIILEETSSSEDGGEPKIEILSQQIILMQWCKLVQMLSERNEKCDRAAASWHGYCLKSGKAHTKTKNIETLLKEALNKTEEDLDANNASPFGGAVPPGQQVGFAGLPTMSSAGPLPGLDAQQQLGNTGSSAGPLPAATKAVNLPVKLPPPHLRGKKEDEVLTGPSPQAAPPSSTRSSSGLPVAAPPKHLRSSTPAAVEAYARWDAQQQPPAAPLSTTTRSSPGLPKAAPPAPAKASPTAIAKQQELVEKQKKASGY